MASSGDNDVVAVVELLLTAHIYNENEQLNTDDLPPRIRKNYWNAKERQVNRPIVVSESSVEKICGISDVRNLVKDLSFVSFDDFGSRISLTVLDLAARWFVNQNTLPRINVNPTLAFYYEQKGDVDVDYAEVRLSNKPKETDREWINSLVDEIAGEGEEAEDMLKLVSISAPEDVRENFKNLVLTSEQEEEVHKIVKAIQYRDYLREIELFEIGKLLFMGPPGTGKTSAARALSKELGLPFLEVRLSMITSQYLGETSKNIDKVFALAKRLSPCTLFIDEFDFVAKTMLDGKTPTAAQLEHEPGADILPRLQFDGYAPETYVGAAFQVGWPHLTAGRHWLTYLCLGKNAAASAYNLGVDDIVLARTGPAAWAAAARVQEPCVPAGPPSALAQALSDPDPVIRGLAAIALRDRGKAALPALAALIAALKDSDPNVRLMSANALAGLGADAAPAVPALIAAGSTQGRTDPGLALVRFGPGRDWAAGGGAGGPLLERDGPDAPRPLGRRGRLAECRVALELARDLLPSTLRMLNCPAGIETTARAFLVLWTKSE